jgi:hypothetical protein
MNEIAVVVKIPRTHSPFALSGVSNSLCKFGSVSFAESVSLKRAKPIAVSYSTSMAGTLSAAKGEALVNAQQV